MATTTLSPETLALFIVLVEDAGNWSGQPMIGQGANVATTKETRGNITDLKRKGLVTTYKDRGDTFVAFTPAAKELAVSLGLGDRYISWN